MRFRIKKVWAISVFVVLALSVLAPFLELNVFEVPEVKANPNPSELRFAVISDIHFGQTPPAPYAEEQQMLETIYGYHPDFIVDCGDWIGNNVPTNWNDAQDAFQTRANFTIFHVLGNHDDQAYYQADRNDLYPTYGIPAWIDEASGDTDVYAYLKDNVLFIFLSAGAFTNNFIRFRCRAFVEYLVAEKYTTQTWMMFVHDGMNATVGHDENVYPQYKSGWWGSTEVWAENFLSTYGSRCLGIFMGHIHYPEATRNATWQYGTYHFPVGMKAEQYFWLVNITATGYTARTFMYDGTEQPLTRMDNTTFTPTYDTTKDDEILIPVWTQDGLPQGQLRIFCLSESRKLDLVGVRGNLTYINPDPWMENFEAPYNTSFSTYRTWQGLTDYGNHWKSKEEMATADDWIHVVNIFNASTVPVGGGRFLGGWSMKYATSGTTYNVSIRIKANQTANASVRQGNLPTPIIAFNFTVTTSWQWIYGTFSSGQAERQVFLYLHNNATYYLDFFGWRLAGVQDNYNTTNPSVTINGNIYNYTGELGHNENYTYSSFPFPSTNYDDITAASVGGSKEVMVVVRYINPEWRITNAAVSKSGSDIDTNTATSDYNDTRIITYMDSSPANPQVTLMRGAITGFLEPSWATNTLTFNATGTGNSIFIVDCATEGNATSVTDNGSPINFSYDSSAELISFNVTLGSEHEIIVTYGGAGGPESIEIYSSSVDDARINVGATAYVRMRCRFSANSSDCTTGTLYINATSCAINGTGWATRTHSRAVVMQVNFTVTGVNVNGLTNYTQLISDPQVTWDKARIYYQALNDPRLNINGYIEFRVRGILLYDNHALGSGDTVIANFGALTWDAGNSWFDGTRTQGTVGSYTFQVSSLSEATYAITSFEVNVSNPTGVYDRLSVTLAASNTIPLNNTDSTISWTIRRQYDNSLVSNFVYTLYRNATSYIVGLTNNSKIENYADLKYNYTTGAVTDFTYGLTAFVTNLVTVTWSANPPSTGTWSVPVTIIWYALLPVIFLVGASLIFIQYKREGLTLERTVVYSVTFIVLVVLFTVIMEVYFV